MRVRFFCEQLLDEREAFKDLKCVYSMAGLDFLGTTREEITLSIVCEIFSIRREGSRKSIMEL